MGAAAAGTVLRIMLERALPGIDDPLGSLLNSGLKASTPSALPLGFAVSDSFSNVFLMAGLFGVLALVFATQLPPGITARTRGVMAEA